MPMKKSGARRFRRTPFPSKRHAIVLRYATCHAEAGGYGRQHGNYHLQQCLPRFLAHRVFLLSLSLMSLMFICL